MGKYDNINLAEKNLKQKRMCFPSLFLNEVLPLIQKEQNWFHCWLSTMGPVLWEHQAKKSINVMMNQGDTE